MGHQSACCFFTGDREALLGVRPRLALALPFLPRTQTQLLLLDLRPAVIAVKCRQLKGTIGQELTRGEPRPEIEQ